MFAHTRDGTQGTILACYATGMDEVELLLQMKFGTQYNIHVKSFVWMGSNSCGWGVERSTIP